jgi:hypothetical protein
MMLRQRLVQARTCALRCSKVQRLQHLARDLKSSDVETLRRERLHLRIALLEADVAQLLGRRELASAADRRCTYQPGTPSRRLPSPSPPGTWAVES